MSLSLPNADLFSLLLWLGCWLGYLWFAHVRAQSRASLLSTLRTYRKLWLRNTLERDNRIADASLVHNLMQSATFFSSTTLLIMGGLLAFLGASEKNLDLLSSLPFAKQQTESLLEIKVLVMLLIFVHAFLRFTWSVRQFNVVCIFIGAFPNDENRMQDPAALDMAERAGNLAGYAGEHFTQGLRSYYYALPVMLWFINPLLFVLASVTITLVVYFMEFHSSTVAALVPREK
ncbi:MAG: DUF599 domain-containing protein [Burkholderiaceae bacterium]|nr:MAG: DUF599 domain-containing protein [Burkholderiaceae bacterium]